MGLCKVCGKHRELKARGMCVTHYEAYRRAQRQVGRCARCSRRIAIGTNGLCYTCAQAVNGMRAVKQRFLKLVGGRQALRYPDARALVEGLEKTFEWLAIKRWLKRAAPEIIGYLQRVGRGERIQFDAIRRLEPLPGGLQLLRACSAILPKEPFEEWRIDRELERLGGMLLRSHALVLQEFWKFELRPQVLVLAVNSKRFDPSLYSYVELLRRSADFLSHIAAMNIAIADTYQSHVDAYVISRPRYYRAKVARFVDWLTETGKIQRWLKVKQPASVAVTESSAQEYLGWLSEVRFNSKLSLEVRAAVILVALSLQPCRDIIRLRKSSIKKHDGDRVEVVFPHGLSQLFGGIEADLLWNLAVQSKDWIFASPWRRLGHRATVGRLVHAAGINVSLRHLRNAGVRLYLEHCDPGELAQMLGWHLGTADAWRKRVGLGLRDGYYYSGGRQ